MKYPFENIAKSESEWPSYYHSSLIVFILFLGYVVYWYLQGGYRFPILGAIRFEFLLGSVLSIAGIQSYFSNPNREHSGLSYWVGLLFFIMIIMVAFSYVPAISYDVFIDRVFKFAMLGFFIAALVTTPMRLGFFIGAFLFCCLKMGQEGLLGMITGSLMWENQGIMRLHGSTPNYQHPNSFTGMALGSLPFVFYFYQIVPWYLRLVLLLLLSLMLNIILFTGSRTGYVGLIIGVFFLCWKSANRMRAFFILLFVSCGLFPFIPQDYIDRAQTIFTGQEKQGASTEARKEILGDAWQIVMDNPLGVGVHAFPAVRRDRFGRTQDTHNLYFEVATNLGIQGLIVFGGFILSLLKVLSRMKVSVTYQIDLVRKELIKVQPENLRARYFQNHLRDLSIMRGTCQAVYIFILIRLILGFFGMDLYEIYWWFALGTTVAIWNLNTVARRRTNALCCDSSYFLISKMLQLGESRLLGEDR